jgi:hypothetical protein
VRCMKTARLDPEMRLASLPPPIRDKKLNQQTPVVARGFSANC